MEFFLKFLKGKRELFRCWYSYINPQLSAKIIVPDGCSYLSNSSQLLFRLLSKLLFVSISSDFYEKYIVTQHFCVSTHNSYRSLENCKFHIFLIGSYFDQILQRLGNFHFTYQIIDCLYTLIEYRFYSNVLSSTGDVFNHFDRAVHHNLK